MNRSEGWLKDHWDPFGEWMRKPPYCSSSLWNLKSTRAGEKFLHPWEREKKIRTKKENQGHWRYNWVHRTLIRHAQGPGFHLKQGGYRDNLVTWDNPPPSTSVKQHTNPSPNKVRISTTYSSLATPNNNYLFLWLNTPWNINIPWHLRQCTNSAYPS